MRLFAVGLSHRTAPVELRECVDFSRGGADEALATLASRGIAREAVVLSTCNRAEIYAVAGPEAPDAVARFFAEYHELPLARLSEHLYVRRGDEAARHLFRVAAGLDSLVVGEPQILGQVKAAYSSSSDRGYTAAVTNRLFHTAFGVGKRVRRETGISEGAVSVSYAAIALARKIFGDLTGLTVLILGAGGMAKLTGQHLKAQQVRQITIASRTLATAERLARELDGRAVPWSELHDALGAADIVITATGAVEPVLTRASVQDVMRPRRQRALFIIDIALPRDVEAGVGDLEQVFLYNIDDLQAVVAENVARRSSEIAHAEAIVAEEAEKFAAWMRSRGAIPTVVALRQRFESIRRAELERLEFKLSALPPEARTRVDEVTRLIVEKLLHMPTEQLKALGDADTIGSYSEALTRLFGLTHAPEDDDDRRQQDRRVEPFVRPKNRAGN
jgi:glutamyl-tRNA reductase